MGLFVVQYSMNKQIEAKNKDLAMLKAMININSGNIIQNTKKTTNVLAPVASTPHRNNTSFAANMWVFK